MVPTELSHPQSSRCSFQPGGLGRCSQDSLFFGEFGSRRTAAVEELGTREGAGDLGPKGRQRGTDLEASPALTLRASAGVSAWAAPVSSVIARPDKDHPTVCAKLSTLERRDPGLSCVLLKQKYWGLER